MDNIISDESLTYVLPVSYKLRVEFANIPHETKILYNIELITFDNINPNGIEYDTVFVGQDEFLIYAVDDGRFYSRPCFHDPVQSIGSLCNRLNESHNSSKPQCIYGQYFNSFKDAINTTITWLGQDPNNLPMCNTPPKS